MIKVLFFMSTYFESQIKRHFTYSVAALSNVTLAPENMINSEELGVCKDYNFF